MTDRYIYEQVRGPLMRFATSLVGPDHAADLVSEVVVATLQRRPLSSLAHPQAYLMKAVLNRARSHGRQTERERRAIARHGETPPLQDPSETWATGIEFALAELPAQQRAAVYLVYWEDMTPSEAAKLLGLRAATLRRYLYLARKNLRRHLDESKEAPR